MHVRSVDEFLRDNKESKIVKMALIVFGVRQKEDTDDQTNFLVKKLFFIISLIASIAFIQCWKQSKWLNVADKL